MQPPREAGGDNGLYGAAATEDPGEGDWASANGEVVLDLAAGEEGRLGRRPSKVHRPDSDS